MLNEEQKRKMRIKAKQGFDKNNRNLNNVTPDGKLFNKVVRMRWV